MTMLKWAANYFSSIPSVFIDGLLYVLILWFGFNQVYFGGDEAAKYISANTKFWLNWGIGSGASIVGGLKAFRSNTFAEHQASKEKSP
jgi:hypothetical protein